MKKIYLLKTLFTLTLFTLILNVNAQSETKEFANYSVGASISLFGGSLGFGYNLTPKTTFQAAIGGSMVLHQYLLNMMVTIMMLRVLHHGLECSLTIDHLKVLIGLD